jgi:hypothetical protein
MNLQNLFLAFFLYTALEAILRIGVLANLAGWKYVTWKIAKPHLSMLISPGYWLAKNCKQLNPSRLNRIALRARLIANYNLWNLLLTFLVFVFILIAQNEGYELLGITISLVVWRAISRSFEIAIAFGNDITTSKNTSRLFNASRMKLAIRSYLEIFLFSAALYAVLGPSLEGISQSILASLYVGTLTNVSYVAEKLPIPHFVFLQVFATLSLVLLSIAGYLGRVKRTK